MIFSSFKGKFEIVSRKSKNKMMSVKVIQYSSRYIFAFAIIRNVHECKHL